MTLQPAIRVNWQVGLTQEPSMKRSIALYGGASNWLVRAGCVHRRRCKSRTDWGNPIHPWYVRHLGSPPSKIFCVSHGKGRERSKMAAFPKPVELGVRVPTVFAGDGVGLFVMCLGISRKESPVEDLSEESQLARA